MIVEKLLDLIAGRLVQLVQVMDGQGIDGSPIALSVTQLQVPDHVEKHRGPLACGDDELLHGSLSALARVDRLVYQLALPVIGHSCASEGIFEDEHVEW